MSCIFFYGLFMDTALLRAEGLDPTVVGPAELHGFGIRIGDRATLVRSPRSTVYGMLVDLTDDEAAALYSAPGVSDYRPESVEAILLTDGTTRVSRCYNLPEEVLGEEPNAEYARQLAELVRELGFPRPYAREIARFAAP